MPVSKVEYDWEEGANPMMAALFKKKFRKELRVVAPTAALAAGDKAQDVMKTQATMDEGIKSMDFDDDEEGEEAQREADALAQMFRQYYRWQSSMKYQIFTLILMQVTAIFCVVYPAIMEHTLEQDMNEIADFQRMQDLSEDVRYYDEVLTMNARLCSLTGAKQFNDIYMNSVPELDLKIKGVLDSVGQSVPDGNALGDSFQTTTKEANDALIALEEQVLAGCTSPDVFDIMQTRTDSSKYVSYVFGDTYEDLKGQYLFGLHQLDFAIFKYIDQEEDNDWAKSIRLWRMGIVMMLLMGLANVILFSGDATYNSSEEERAAGLDAWRHRALQKWLETDFAKNVQSKMQQELHPHIVLDDAKEGGSADKKAKDAAARARKEAGGIISWLTEGCGGCWRALIPDMCRRPSPRQKIRDLTYLQKWQLRMRILVQILAVVFIMMPSMLQNSTEELIHMGHDLRYFSKLFANIRYYDEVLTQSARLCALTGDVRWKARYLMHEGPIISDIEMVISEEAELREKYPMLSVGFKNQQFGVFFEETTAAANEQLVSWEKKVLSVCAKPGGASSEERMLLFSADYYKKKEQLISGLAALQKEVRILVEKQQKDNQTTVDTHLTLVVVLCVVEVVLSGFVMHYEAKRRRLEQLVENIMQRRKRKKLESWAETTLQPMVVGGAVKVAHQKLCMCGRPAAPGFNTCCRKCALSGGKEHDSHCDAMQSA